MACRGGTRESIGKPIRCKAAICRKAGETLVIEDVELDPPKAWEVRIKILCTSVCHSDVTIWKMDKAPVAQFPRIFGPEAARVVESVGEDMKELKEGDIVVPVFWECIDCKSPKSNICSEFGNKWINEMPRDGTSRFRDVKGEVSSVFPASQSTPWWMSPMWSKLAMTFLLIRLACLAVEFQQVRAIY